MECEGGREILPMMLMIVRTFRASCDAVAAGAESSSSSSSSSNAFLRGLPGLVVFGFRALGVAGVGSTEWSRASSTRGSSGAAFLLS